MVSDPDLIKLEAIELNQMPKLAAVGGRYT